MECCRFSQMRQLSWLKSFEIQSIFKNELIIMRTSGLMIMKFWNTVDLQKWIDCHENEWSQDYEILKHCWASRCVSVDWNTVEFWKSVVKFWSIVKLQRRDEFLSIEILSNFESLSWNFEALLSFKEEMNFCRYCRILKICREILKYFEVHLVFKNKEDTMIIVTSWMEDSVGF